MKRRQRKKDERRRSRGHDHQMATLTIVKIIIKPLVRGKNGDMRLFSLRAFMPLCLWFFCPVKWIVFPPKTSHAELAREKRPISR